MIQWKFSIFRYTLYLSATDQAADHSLRRSSLAIVQVRIGSEVRDVDDNNDDDIDEDDDDDEGNKRPRRVVSNGHTTPRNQGLFGTRFDAAAAAREGFDCLFMEDYSRVCRSQVSVDETAPSAPQIEVSPAPVLFSDEFQVLTVDRSAKKGTPIGQIKIVNPSRKKLTWTMRHRYRYGGK